MKKVVFVLGLLVVSFGMFAQSENHVKRSDLQGPAYKNYKPWKHKTESPKTYIVTKKKSLTGPAYKNYKPWKEGSKVETVVVKNRFIKSKKLKGPAYKNHKPWIKR